MATQKREKTSWGAVAEWYNALLEGNPKSYQRDVILPNLLRVLELKKGETIVDIACGQGFFLKAFSETGARVIGVDISRELIQHARKNIPEGVILHSAPADSMPFIKDGSIEKASIILAIQNIADIHGVLKEASRMLRPEGKLVLVMNHPAFRIPRASAWVWDEKQKTQYRRIDRYLSESKVKMNMHPGKNLSECTLSFHRPLQFYFKSMHKNGFYVSKLEEWISHKKSASGPRSRGEDMARREIPLFLCMEAVKHT